MNDFKLDTFLYGEVDIDIDTFFILIQNALDLFYFLAINDEDKNSIRYKQIDLTCAELSSYFAFIKDNFILKK